jgi:hypothetical protein
MAAEVASHEEALELWVDAKYGAAEIEWGEDGFTVVYGHNPVISSSYKVMAKSRCAGGTFIYELLRETASRNVYFIVMVSPDGDNIAELVDDTLKPGATDPQGNFILTSY